MRERGPSLPIISQPGSEPEPERKDESEAKENREGRSIQRIALATTNQMDTGIRAVSAILKDNGFDVMKMNLYEDKRHKSGANYSEEEIQEIIERLKEFKADALGISVFEVGSNRAFALAKKAKEELGIAIIFGGQHAIQYPDECLEAGADAVVIGEGEIGFVDLLEHWDERLERKNYNVVVKQEDLAKVNEIRGLLLTEDEISKLTPDFTYNNYFALRDGKMVLLTPDDVKNPEHHQTDRAKRTFIYASDRGCPLNCSFCYVSDMRQKSIQAHLAQRKSPNEKATQFLRRKNSEAVIRDLEVALKENPWIEFLNIMNDDTAARELEGLQVLSKLYKEKINKPFYCMVSSMSLWDKEGYIKAKSPVIPPPELVTEGRGKIQALVAAGLKELNTGVQTNGKTNWEKYNRFQPDVMLLQVTDMLHEFAREDLDVEQEGKVDLFYDFILHNPLETREDTKRTIELIKRLKTPFDLVPHTLYIGKKSKYRHQYEYEKKKASEEGRPYEKVLEDIVGESDFHDTHKFYDYLAANRKFVMNTAIEFTAGRHDERMTGRIPRHAKDLLEYDVFKNLREKHAGLQKVLEQQQVAEDMLSIDLLTSETVDNYFWENKDVFKELFIQMHELHPIVQSNERKEPEAGPSRKGRRFTEG